MTTPCWCGEKKPFYSDEHHKTCAGSGVMHCFCGGDDCSCHHHGTVTCDGCADCEEPGDNEVDEEPGSILDNPHDEFGDEVDG